MQDYLAASKLGSAQALFNLGFQHQFGAGLPQVCKTMALSALFLSILWMSRCGHLLC